MNDFYEYAKSAGEILHKGAPYAFFLKHQKKYLIAAEEKKREKRLRTAVVLNCWVYV